MRNTKWSNQTIILITILLLSIFLVNCFLKTGFDLEYLKLDYEDIAGVLEIKFSSLFIYTIIKRLKQIILIWFAMRTLNSKFIFKTVIGFMCGFYGVMSTVQSYYLDVQGLFILIAFILPHYIIYIVLLYFMSEYCYEDKSCSRSEEGTKNAGMAYIKNEDKYKIFAIFIVLGCFGIISEIFFSRFFLLQYYQYMVLG